MIGLVSQNGVEVSFLATVPFYKLLLASTLSNAEHTNVTLGYLVSRN